MSYHFEPTVDSSSDEAPDLERWKFGAKPVAEIMQEQRPSQPMNSSPAAQGAATIDLNMENALAAHDGPEDDYEAALATVDNLAEHILENHGGAPNESDGDGDGSIYDLSAAPGFTSINKPSSQPATRRLSGSFNKILEDPKALLIPQVVAGEVNPLDFIDSTGGYDVPRRVLRELQDQSGNIAYEVEFQDRHVEKISFEKLLEVKNGRFVLEAFETGEDEDTETFVRGWPSSRMPSVHPGRKSNQDFGFVNTVEAVPLTDDDSEPDKNIAMRGVKRKRDAQYEGGTTSGSGSDDELLEDESEADWTRRRVQRKAARPRRKYPGRRAASRLPFDHHDNSSEDDDLPRLSSNVHRPQRSRGRQSGRERGNTHRGPPNVQSDIDEYDSGQRGNRHSGRSTRHQGGMREIEENEIDLSDSQVRSRTPPKPKVTGAREAFRTLPRNDEFRIRHNQDCESCGQGGNFAPLVYCQGCTLAYHKSCLGHRTSRDHLVTKIGDGDFVLQCRRCIAFSRNKDRTAPDQGRCSDCHEHGNACRPFRPRKTPAQEQRERDENDGEDPSYQVDSSRVNEPQNVLFRCLQCFRAFHFVHLPSRSDIMDMDMEIDAEQRFREYSRDWKCKDCLRMPAKPSGLIAWKPIDEDNFDGSHPVEDIEEDEKAYLVKWDGMSYFRASWMPGAWVWGVAAPGTRKAFLKREDAQHPKMRTEDAIPEDYLRADIVLDIKFTSIVDIRTEEIDKARIREVDKALVKYKGLGYEDAVWEAPPSPEDGDRWTDFVTAYNDWVLGRYVRQPRPSVLKAKLEKARQQDFSKLEKERQPDNLEGGELMKYQVDGLNWLYYKWFTKQNAILADEMGLGKTIQVIGFLATLVQDWNCCPFLVVVPNSTCPNWRRECKRWAPSLRVVTYYGSRESRNLSYQYELFPENSKDLRCHVVVTSYEAASDDSSRKFLRGVNWQGLIVDEGQRLKNDRNQLYASLGALKAPFRVLLTGTPLQNNQRELFNLLHFLDSSYDAARLEGEYADSQLDSLKIAELHEMIRPFFLRRTKVQVLTFLPPMAQIIVPISMTLVQKKLYRTILAKNPDLMKAIFSSEQTAKQAERASLNNVLMQLRKCLCHPFVYNKSIEERNIDFHASHRNLVDASSKLKLLELLLPKLKERGHRVLIFSQFLDMLDIVEDFLDGMEMRHQRLDGSISALQKQKRIDEFNAPDSELFVFLLSTRSGGVGINLATADTVIILDPDFNPHQDIQALSRAHRIGQRKKVLCFQFVTRASAEERIMQIGRKKLVLDHVLIQEMDTEYASESNLVSVLRHGAAELFEDSGEQDIQYDGASVERLLDRSHIENPLPGEDKTAETQFSTARVWANDPGTLQDEIPNTVADEAPDPGVWANILKERERIAAEEAAAKAEAFGRGRRARGAVDYANDLAADAGEGVEVTPVKKTKTKTNADSDTDFQADESEGEDDASEGEEIKGIRPAGGELKAKHVAGRPNDPSNTFKRVTLPTQRYVLHGMLVPQDDALPHSALPISVSEGVNCVACKTFHPVGSCPLKVAGVEYCNLCGMAHFGSSRVCPHIQSETQVRAMLEALRHSNEAEHLVVEARRYLRGVKGHLVQMKKQRETKAQAMREAQARAVYEISRGPVWRTY